MYLVYLHLLSLIAFASGLIGAHLSAIGKQSPHSLQLLVKFEKTGFAGLILMLISGLGLLLGSGKGIGFYFGNGATHAKLTLVFILLILGARHLSLAIKAKTQGLPQLGKGYLMTQRIMLLALIALPLLGLSMAQGHF